jgi:dihydroneopterin aldolase
VQFPERLNKKQQINMHQIIVEGIHLYAYHGCLEEEGKIGSNYIVDVSMQTDFTEAAQTDDLTKTIDYVMVYRIAREEMAIRAKLLEQVAQRIIQRLKKEFASLQKVEVKVTKLNPPMNGNVERVSVVITE